MSTQTLEILERLVAFPTLPRTSNLDLVAYVEAYLAERGFAVSRVPGDAGDRVGLVATKGEGDGGVVLSAHTDVVPVEGQAWSRDPFRLHQQDGKVFGRGTTDMKGFVASAMALADRAAKAQLAEPLRIVLSFDEEVGCIGIAEMLDRLPPLIGQPRACIVGEPTEMRVAIGHKGKVALSAVCHGEAGHSAMAPNFTNALYVASDFTTSLRALQDEIARTGAKDTAYDIPYTTLHVGKLNGGTALNIVPDRAEMLFEFRHLAADDPKVLRQRIDDLAARAGEVEISEYFSYPGLDVPEDREVVSYVARMAGTNEGTTKVPFGTEAGFFDQMGVPTVVCGPGSMEGQGHKPDEYVTLSQLAACDAMMDRILQDISH